jgi:hypothetical protein
MTTAAVVAYYTEESKAKSLMLDTPLFYTGERTTRPGPMQDRPVEKVKVMVFH